MKTTLDINDRLLANAKALAAQQHTSLTRLIEEGLQMRLAATKASAGGRRTRVPVHRGKGGLVAGIDPSSNKSLLEAADDDAAVDVRVRFLHVVRRQVLDRGRPVDEASAGGARHLSWDEASEREIGPGPVYVPAGEQVEPLGEGVEVVRTWEALRGAVEVRAERLQPGLHRVTVAEIDGTRVRVRELEALDGTPIVDVKPLLRAVDER